MATSGSLNFISASDYGSYYIPLPLMSPLEQTFGDTKASKGDDQFIPTDFAGINSNIYEPITSSHNALGYPQSVSPTASFNSPDFIKFLNATSKPMYFNALLLHRNGPYQHPSWKQIRGGDHPVARKLRLNNTMSIDPSDPDPIVRNKRILRDRYLEEQVYPLGSDAKYLKTSTPPESTLSQYYEPSVVKKHKPFIYSVSLFGSTAKVRSTLMNQMVYFENKEINNLLKLAAGDQLTGTFQGFKKSKQQYYKLIDVAKDMGATNFIYSQTIFPKSINTFRTYKLERPTYEEVAGTGSNGYDRTINRSFWKDSQPALAQNIGSDGTTRARTVGTALNSQDITQSMHLSGNWGVYASIPGTASLIEGKRALINPTSAETPIDWNFSQSFMQNGIIAHSAQATVTGSPGADGIPTIAPYGAFVPLEAYQPYPISLTSMWPLDPRPDIYDKPGYLTSSIGGRGLQIGVTPHRMKEFDTADASLQITDSPYFTSSLSSSTTPRIITVGIDPQNGYQGAFDLATNSTASYSQFANILTGTAGELVYSTKPTIWYTKAHYDTELEGYLHPTASLQYNRHTFPYNTPFYATNRIRGKNPSFNLYSDYASSLEYIAREYSIIPEYRVTENLDDYLSLYMKDKLYEQLYKEKVIGGLEKDSLSNAVSKGEAQGKTTLAGGGIVTAGKRKILRNVSLDLGNNASHKTKVNNLLIDGVAASSSAGVESFVSASATKDSFTFVPLTQLVTASLLPKIDIHWTQDSASVVFSEKYSHTEGMSDAANIIGRPFDNGVHTIPSRIKFKVKAVKKPRLSKNFYPITKTVEIGNDFKNLISENLSPNSNTAKDLQAFLEPTFAPGILYNSIKSGIAVDYPVHRAIPFYHAPIPFLSGGLIGPSEGGQQRSYRYTEDRFEGHISATFNYGGFYQLGACRAIPAILNRATDYRIQFESIYSPSGLLQLFSKEYKLFLTTDFLSLDDATSGIDTNPAIVGVSQSQHHPGYAAPFYPPAATLTPHAKTLTSGSGLRDDYEPESSLTEKKYTLSINNFLSEMMNFYLVDQDLPGVKLPVAVSTPRADDHITFDSNKTYYMEVALHMGKDHVGCEGPRDAGIGGGGLVETIYTTGPSTMRGYIYGPPTEIVQMSGSTTIEDFPALFDPFTGQTSGRVEPAVASWFDAPGSHDRQRGDYESYFGANLQDPAYQAHTPPYFYGESSMLVTYTPPEDESTFNNMFIKAKITSFYHDTYITGATTEHLCRVAPGTSSISMLGNARMKIDSSVDIFNAPVPIVHNPSDGTIKQPNMYVWYMSPKWVCPVLDFSSSFSSVQETFNTPIHPHANQEKNTYTVITNSFHDTTTGRGLWGGYGTDPYDLLAQKEISKAEGKPGARPEKGVFLTLKYPFTNEEKTTELTTYQTENFAKKDKTGFYTGISQQSKFTASLGPLLGFQPPDDSSKTFKIGQIAEEKEISEAIVVIPYLERPIRIMTKPNTLPGREIFATREIIPGKHFLPIQKKLYENILSMVFTERKFSTYPGDPVARLVEGKSNYLGFETQESVSAAKNTDVYKMINLLLGDETEGRLGYELPPEFDFINYGVDPFQMFVIPFEHTFNKQELVDMYQGILPDSADKFSHEDASYTINPTRPLDLPGQGNASMTPSWMPFFTEAAGGGSLAEMAPQNFLNPSFIKLFGISSTREDNISINASINRSWLKNPRHFYQNVKFMTFKVKQKAMKDYDGYKQRQLQRTVSEKIYSSIVNPALLEEITLPSFTTNLSRNVKDVFGGNWPYDNISIIEAVKIDIEMEIEK